MASEEKHWLAQAICLFCQFTSFNNYLGAIARYRKIITKITPQKNPKLKETNEKTSKQTNKKSQTNKTNLSPVLGIENSVIPVET